MTNRFAIIEDGVVTNVAIADAEYAAEQGWIACPLGGPGWLYDGENFIEPPPSVPEPPPAPEVTKEQLLAQLEKLQQQILALG